MFRACKNLRQCIFTTKSGGDDLEIVSVIRSVDVVSVKTYDLTEDFAIRIVERNG